MRPSKLLTLALVIDTSEQKILLGYKKRGFGTGKWNGFGGKVETGETIAEAAQRELYEEAGVRMVTPKQVGELVFEFKGVDELLHVHVFTSNEYTGVITESEEMRPKWFPISVIPYDLMWADDKYWLPLALTQTSFKGHFLFDDQSTISSYTLTEL